MAEQKTGKLFLLSSPSGAGKTTLIPQVIEQLRPVHEITRVITYTTRPARATDRQGIDYHFLSRQEFTEKIEQQFFLEWSTAYDHYYGTPRDIVQKVEQGASFIAVVDRTGVHSIKQAYQQAIAIWVEVAHVDVLAQRLRARAVHSEESEAQVQRRLQIAQREHIEEAVNQIYTYRVLNDELSRASAELLRVITHELTNKKGG